MAPRGGGAGAQPGPRAGGARRVHLRDRRPGPPPPPPLPSPPPPGSGSGSGPSSADPPRCETSGSAEKEEIAARAAGRMGAARAGLGVGVHLAPRDLAVTSWPPEPLPCAPTREEAPQGRLGRGGGLWPCPERAPRPRSLRAPPGLCSGAGVRGSAEPDRGLPRGGGGAQPQRIPSSWGAGGLPQGPSPGASVGHWAPHGGLPARTPRNKPQAQGGRGAGGGGKSLHLPPVTWGLGPAQ